MVRAPIIGTLVQRRVSVVAVGALLLALMVPSPSQANTTIGTTSSWNETAAFGAFGYGENTATYGEVVTIPAGETSLESFTFYPKIPTQLVFRAYIYAWGGTDTTGPDLFEGPEMHTTESAAFQPMTVKTGGVLVTPGDQYVLFFSISKDQAANEAGAKAFEEGGGEAEEEFGGPWGGKIAHSDYPEGEYVYTNNHFNTAEWAEEKWESFGGGSYGSSPAGTENGNLAFTAALGNPPAVSGVAPQSEVKAGAQVTITGEGFTGATEVLFGEVPAASFVVNSDGSITAVAPAGVTGTVDVRVLTPAGKSTSGASDRVGYAAVAPTTPVVTPTVTVTSTPTAVPLACRSARSEDIHWKVPRGVRLGRTDVTVNAKMYRSLPSSAREIRVGLEGRSAGEAVVKILGRSRAGVKYASTRGYHLCVAGARTTGLKDLYLRAY